MDQFVIPVSVGIISVIVGVVWWCTRGKAHDDVDDGVPLRTQGKMRTKRTEQHAAKDDKRAVHANESPQDISVQDDGGGDWQTVTHRKAPSPKKKPSENVVFINNKKAVEETVRNTNSRFSFDFFPSSSSSANRPYALIKCPSVVVELIGLGLAESIKMIEHTSALTNFNLDVTGEVVVDPKSVEEAEPTSLARLPPAEAHARAVRRLKRIIDACVIKSEDVKYDGGEGVLRVCTSHPKANMFHAMLLLLGTAQYYQSMAELDEDDDTALAHQSKCADAMFLFWNCRTFEKDSESTSLQLPPAKLGNIVLRDMTLKEAVIRLHQRLLALKVGCMYVLHTSLT